MTESWSVTACRWAARVGGTKMREYSRACTGFGADDYVHYLDCHDFPILFIMSKLIKLYNLNICTVYLMSIIPQ